MSVVSLQDVRDEGITVAVASDDKVLKYIAIFEAAFEKACGQWFVARSVVATFDGDNTATKFFHVPIISISEVYDLDDEVAIDADDLVIYAGRVKPSDDRRNPKITIKNQLFYTGRQRYRVTGDFGYLEPDDSAPGDVWYAMLKLIIEKLLTPIVGTSANLINAQLLPAIPALPLVEHVTDDHKRKWSNNAVPRAIRRANSGLTMDPFVLETINNYMAPMKLRTQTDWSVVEGFPTDAQILNSIYG